MKTRIPLMLLLTLLPLTVAYDNPLVPEFLSELVIYEGGDWAMELRFYGPEVLNGWGVASQTDTAYLKPGMIGGQGYFVFPRDSLQKPVLFNPSAERIVLLTPYGPGGRLIYGNLPNSDLTPPRYGQSISHDFDSDFHYFDNTPTLGSANDTVNGMGDIVGIVTDTLGSPLEGVIISDGAGVYLGSDTLGQFGLHYYARQLSLWFSRDGYNTRQVIAQMYPDSVVTLTVRMTTIVSVDRLSAIMPASVRLLPNYPNPFNPVTTLSYELPRAMDVRLTVFDLQGRSVAVLVDGRKEAGVHRTAFDGSALPSGIYFCRLRAEKFVGTDKLVLLR